MQNYEMPPIEVGDPVLWYPTGERSNAGLPAFVTQVNADSLCLSVLSLNTYNLLLRDGVRHLTDPRRKQAELIENGVWDYTPRFRRLLEMEQQVANLRQDVDLLRGVIESPVS